MTALLVGAVVAVAGGGWLAADESAAFVVHGGFIADHDEPETTDASAATAATSGFDRGRPVRAAGSSVSEEPAGVEVVVRADGEERHETTEAEDVGALLADLDIELGDDDRVEPDVDASLTDGMVVEVVRTETRTEEREVAIAYDVDTRKTDSLPEGERRVAEEGREGLVVITERVTMSNGTEQGREEVDRRVAREPVDRVEDVGTAGREPEPQSQPTSRATSAPPPSPSPTPRRTSQPTPQPSGSGRGDPADPASWDRLAQCESGGNWEANTGNGYYGGLQFHPDTWRAVGGSGLPHEHPRETQIRMGQRLHARQGWSAWPECSSELGYR